MQILYNSRVYARNSPLHSMRKRFFSFAAQKKPRLAAATEVAFARRGLVLNDSSVRKSLRRLADRDTDVRDELAGSVLVGKGDQDLVVTRGEELAVIRIDRKGSGRSVHVHDIAVLLDIDRVGLGSDALASDLDVIDLRFRIRKVVGKLLHTSQDVGKRGLARRGRFRGVRDFDRKEERIDAGQKLEFVLAVRESGKRFRRDGEGKGSLVVLGQRVLQIGDRERVSVRKEELEGERLRFRLIEGERKRAVRLNVFGDDLGRSGIDDLNGQALRLAAARRGELIFAFREIFEERSADLQRVAGVRIVARGDIVAGEDDAARGDDGEFDVGRRVLIELRIGRVRDDLRIVLNGNGEGLDDFFIRAEANGEGVAARGETREEVRADRDAVIRHGVIAGGDAAALDALDFVAVLLELDGNGVTERSDFREGERRFIEDRIAVVLDGDGQSDARVVRRGDDVLEGARVFLHKTERVDDEGSALIDGVLALLQSADALDRVAVEIELEGDVRFRALIEGRARLFRGDRRRIDDVHGQDDVSSARDVAELMRAHRQGVQEVLGDRKSADRVDGVVRRGDILALQSDEFGLIEEGVEGDVRRGLLIELRFGDLAGRHDRRLMEIDVTDDVAVGFGGKSTASSPRPSAKASAILSRSNAFTRTLSNFALAPWISTLFSSFTKLLIKNLEPFWKIGYLISASSKLFL